LIELHLDASYMCWAHLQVQSGNPTTNCFKNTVLVRATMSKIHPKSKTLISLKVKCTS